MSKELRNLKGISYASLNIRSLSKKIDDISILLNRTNLELLSLTETWFNESISDHELEISDYSFHRFDRDLGSGKRGGGHTCVLWEQT